jgi:hypothetical protein
VTKSKPTPPAELLWEELDYNPLTGALYWRRSKSGRRTPRNQRIGFQNEWGYWRVRLCYRNYFQHLLIWKWVTGEDLPDGHHLDHINGVKSDNSWGNLRVLSHGANLSHRKTKGYTFVNDVYRSKPWRVNVYTQKGKPAREYFATEAEAKARAEEVKAQRIARETYQTLKFDGPVA